MTIVDLMEKLNQSTVSKFDFEFFENSAIFQT